MIQKIKDKVQQKYNPSSLHGIFIYGSSVYLNKEPTDVDVIVVTDTSIIMDDFINSDGIKLDLHIIPLQEFKNRLQDHDVVIMECIINNEKCILTDALKNILDSFVLEPQALRSSFSKVSSNSYVKAKKKLIVPETYDVLSSMKSLWHSFRILQFGIQIIYHYKSKSDFNWQVSNDLWDSIVLDYEKLANPDPEIHWRHLNSKYKSLRSSLNTEFRKVAPKR